MKSNSEPLKTMEDKMNDNLLKEKPYKMVSAISFAIVMLGVGLPIWWVTTTVYRAPFQNALIKQLREIIIEVPLNVKVVMDPLLRNNVQHIVSELEATVAQVNQRPGLKSKINFKLITEIAELSDKQIKLIKNSNDFQNLDDKMRLDLKETTDFEITFCLVSPKNLKFSKSVYLGKGSIAYIVDQDNASGMVVDSLWKVYMNIDALEHVTSTTIHNADVSTIQSQSDPTIQSQSDPTIQSQSDPTIQSQSDSKVWQSTSRSAYNVDIYFMNPDSVDCDSTGITDTSDLLRPLQESLKSITDIQITYHHIIDVNLNLNPVWDEKMNAFLVNERDLAHIVTPIEEFVPTVQPSNPVYRIIVYMPKRGQQPLLIVDKKGIGSTGNGFAIASWGGVSVWNGCTNKTRPTYVPSKVVASMIGQLRVLLNIDTYDRSRVQRYPAPISDWEVASLAMHSTIDNILQSIGCVTSLERLLDKITNMVISDNVARHIDSASNHALIAIQKLKESNVQEALLESKVALSKSEQAFFHPTLLSLLYFPDDQKYAIYIPLFLPVGLPVLLSIKMIAAYFKKEKTDIDLKKDEKKEQ